jgi:hypothetical protein
MEGPETGSNFVEADWQPLDEGMTSRIRAGVMQNGSERTLAPGDSLPSECELTGRYR